MTKIIGTDRVFEFLVNCKTYPAISKKYIETVCTGGVEPEGQFVRLYPVPFRFLDDDEKYDRWDVIRVAAYRDSKDRRPESWHLKPGCKIEIVKKKLANNQVWDWMSKTVYTSVEEMDSRGVTNGCVEIEPVRLYWEPEDRTLSASQMNATEQLGLFYAKDQIDAILDDRESLPYQFRLEYRIAGQRKIEDKKILAWSYYAGAVRRKKEGMSDSEALNSTIGVISKSIFNPKKRTFAIFGTHSRYGHWMISALYHVLRKYADRGGLLF